MEPVGGSGRRLARTGKLLAVAALTLTEATLSFELASCASSNNGSLLDVAGSGAGAPQQWPHTSTASTFDDSIKLANQLLPNMVMINKFSSSEHLEGPLPASLPRPARLFAGPPGSLEEPAFARDEADPEAPRPSNESTWALLLSALFYQPGSGEQEFKLNWFNLILTLILIMLMLTTMVGNAFVIIAILIERNLRTIGNYLVLSLAFADLFVAILVMPLAGIYQILEQWTLGALLCDVWTSADVFCCTASILHLLAIALDRYWAVTRVDYIRCQRNEGRILLMISIVWMFAGVISIAPMLGWKDANFEERLIKDKECLVSQDISFQIVATCTSFYFPLTLTLIFYWKIYQVARKRIRRKPGNRVKISLQHPSSSSSISSPGSKTLLQNQKTKQQAIYQSIVECSASKCKPGKYSTKSTIGRQIASAKRNEIDQRFLSCQCSCHLQSLTGKESEEQGGQFNLNAGIASSAVGAPKMNGAKCSSAGAGGSGRLEGERSVGLGRSPLMMIPDGGLGSGRSNPPDGRPEPPLPASGSASRSCSSSSSSSLSTAGHPIVGAGPTTEGCPDGRLRRREGGGGEPPGADTRDKRQQQLTTNDNKSTQLNERQQDNDLEEPNDNPEIDMVAKKSKLDNQIYENDIMVGGQSNDGAIQTKEPRNSTTAVPSANGSQQTGASRGSSRVAEGACLERMKLIADYKNKHSTNSKDDLSRDETAHLTNSSHSSGRESLTGSSGSPSGSGSLSASTLATLEEEEEAEQQQRQRRARSGGSLENPTRHSGAPSKRARANCCAELHARRPAGPPQAATHARQYSNESCLSLGLTNDNCCRCCCALEHEEGASGAQDLKCRCQEGIERTAPEVADTRLCLAGGDPTSVRVELLVVSKPAASSADQELQAELAPVGRATRMLKLIPARVLWRSLLGRTRRLLSRPASSGSSEPKRNQLSECLVLIGQDGRSQLAGKQSAGACNQCNCPADALQLASLDDSVSTSNVEPEPVSAGNKRPLKAQLSRLSNSVQPQAAASAPVGEGIESKRERKAAKTLAIITGVFVMCWLPFFVMAITMPLLDIKPHKYIFALLLWLGYTNSMLNPIIYTIFSPDFRKAFKRLICRNNEDSKGPLYSQRNNSNHTPRSTIKKTDNY